MKIPLVLVFSKAWGQSSNHIGAACARLPLSLHWGGLPAPTRLTPGLALEGVARDPQCPGGPCAWLLADSLLGHGLRLGLGACCPGPLPPSVSWPVLFGLGHPVASCPPHPCQLSLCYAMYWPARSPRNAVAGLVRGLVAETGPGLREGCWW